MWGSVFYWSGAHRITRRSNPQRRVVVDRHACARAFQAPDCEPSRWSAREALEPLCQRDVVATAMAFRQAAEESLEVRMLPKLADMFARGPHLSFEGSGDVDDMVNVVSHDQEYFANAMRPKPHRPVSGVEQWHPA